MESSGGSVLTVEEIDSLGNNSISYTVLNTNRSFDKIKLNSFQIDGYVIHFDILLQKGDKIVYPTIKFNTIFGRSNEEMKWYKEKLTSIGYDVSRSFTDPNAGSIWSTLLPMFGSLVIAVVFFILSMQTQGGTKGAMNFAKTNARIHHNIKVRFSDVAGAEEEKAELAEVVDFLKTFP